jgi:hypothetical protein
MPTDYAKVFAEYKRNAERQLAAIGRFLASHYTERTHFIFELLQNAEDALRRREEAEPACRLPRSVKFVLFPDHLEVTHYGLPFDEDDVRAICSIIGTTKDQNLTDIGKFGIGFKSVYVYTKRPEVHSGDEHFVIESYVHPCEIASRQTKPGQTLFYIPFDHDNIQPDQAYFEISERLAKLGFRTLLFLNQIESVDWEVADKAAGSYIRESKRTEHCQEVTLIGEVRAGQTTKAVDEQHWIIFSKSATTAKGEPAGQVEIAFKLATGDKASKRSIVKAEDSSLVVFFPTEKETHCGFLMQGPYKTTPSRDNIPHDNKWNALLVKETAKLVSETLLKLRDMKLASVGLLQAMPLLRAWEIPDDWMFRPVYDAIVQTLRQHPLIPTVGGGLVSARCARFARGKGLVDLLTPDQLSLLFSTNDDEKLAWVAPEISEARGTTSDVFSFLRHELGVAQLEPENLPPYMTEEFFRAQTTSWMVKFYAFLLDHDRLWRKPRGALLGQPFIRLQHSRHVTPFRVDGAPNVFLPSDTESEFDTVHRLLAKPKKCAEFLRRLGLTEPDITSEVLQKVVPQYEPDEISVPDRKHLANLRKIFRALTSESPSRSVLVEQLKDLYFLHGVKPGSEETFRCKPQMVYLRTRQLETYFENHKEVWFLSELEELVERDKIKTLLKELGVEDKPRRIPVETEGEWTKQRELRQGCGYAYDIHFLDYDIHGLGDFLQSLKKLDFSEATHRARILWDFLLHHLEARPPNTERDFFRGEYKWHYYKVYTRHFPAYFLTVLRSKAWLPGKDGELHKPCDLLPQEMAFGFKRHPILCEELQMKVELLINLAKEAGLKVEDLVFIRQHREEFEKLKRSIKAKPPVPAKPIGTPSPATPAPVSTPAPADEPQRSSPSHQTAEAAPERETHVVPTPSPDEIAGAINAILGTDADRPTVMPTELDKPEFAPRAEGTAAGVGGPKASHDTAYRGPGIDGSRSTGTRPQDGKHFTYVYVTPPGIAQGGADTDVDPAEAERREKVERQGVDFVLKWETNAGRFPTEMPQTHEGYDVESRNAVDEVECFIEVKAISAAWGERGVTLSQAQFAAAQRLKDKYWLYVVEDANSTAPKLNRIQNPALKVKCFAYDQGWRELSEKDGGP